MHYDVQVNIFGKIKGIVKLTKKYTYFCSYIFIYCYNNTNKTKVLINCGNVILLISFLTLSKKLKFNEKILLNYTHLLTY